VISSSEEEVDGAAGTVVVVVEGVVVVVPEAKGVTVPAEGAGLIDPPEREGTAVTTMTVTNTEMRKRFARSPNQVRFVLRNLRQYLSIIPITEW
jgi:hypothetical protein